ncbi:hypothetical protein [Thermococcus chitonophagus]|uniref:hypothetical protein n=1 Tax=Thermococcus chitonophagus TaxID=54262 RepID=UPI0012EE85DE|nr:hypothetical protein [Thermococcus chitonophagus]
MEFLKFDLLLFLVSLVVGTLVFLGPLGLIFAFVVVIGIGYFLYATPYLIILYGVKVEEAIGKSLKLSLSGGEYLEYAVKYGGLTLFLSIPNDTNNGQPRGRGTVPWTTNRYTAGRHVFSCDLSFP